KQVEPASAALGLGGTPALLPRACRPDYWNSRQRGILGIIGDQHGLAFLAAGQVLVHAAPLVWRQAVIISQGVAPGLMLVHSMAWRSCCRARTRRCFTASVEIASATAISATEKSWQV